MILLLYNNKRLLNKENSMKKLFTFLLVAILVSQTVLTTASAKDITNEQIEYFDDGSYMVTTISDTIMNNNYGIALLSTTTTKTKTKRVNFYNGSNKLLWYFQVKGTFTYGNGSAKCTKSEVSAKSYNTYWKLSNKSASKSGNKATASVTAKLCKGSTVYQTLKKKVTLTCSATGKFS